MHYKLPVRTQRYLDKHGSIPEPLYTPQWTGPLKLRPDHQALVDPTLGFLGWRNRERCRCKENIQTEYSNKGIFETVCSTCGLCFPETYIESYARESDARCIPNKNRYDFKTHLHRHLQPLVKAGAPGHVVKRLQGLFPAIYRAYFRIHPKRKNFTSYGFILRNLLVREGMTQYCHVFPTLKTPSKLEEAQETWAKIRERLGL